MSTKRIFGIIFSVLSFALIIWALIRITSFAGQLHSWSPPFAKYEIITIVVGGIGLILLIIGLIFIFSNNKNTLVNPSNPKIETQSQQGTLNVKISAQQVSEASKDAIEVSKSFMSDPVGGISNVYLKLGETKSLSVGILFLIITIVVFVIGSSLNNSPFFMGLFSVLFMLCILFISLFVSRGFLNGKGTIHSDIFITGLSLLPLSILILVSSLMNVSFGWGFFAYLSFGLTFTTLIMFSCLTKIYQYSESKSSILIAIILFLAINSLNVVFKIYY